MPGSGEDGGLGAPGFSFFVSTAVRMKIRSPHTTGVAEPEPGSSTFHVMFFVSLHRTGGSALGATPSPFGPRNWGQLSSGSWAGRPSRNAENIQTIIVIILCYGSRTTGGY